MSSSTTSTNSLIDRWVVPYVGLPRVWRATGEWLPLLLAVASAAVVIWFVRHAVEARYNLWRDLARAAHAIRSLGWRDTYTHLRAQGSQSTLGD